MNTRKTNGVAVAILVAVIFISLALTGCATKRDIDQINSRLSEIEGQNRGTLEMVARMDSVISAGAESNARLQNDVRYSTEELTSQMTQLLENYTDLMSRLDQVSQQQVIHVAPTSSPGAQTDTQVQPTAEEPPPSSQPSIDCINAYDSAFTLVRRGDYDKAISGFRSFLEECQEHTDIENAFYWIGECYYSMQKYTQAIAEYEHLLENHPESPNAGRALYKLARCKQETDKTDEARELFQRLVDDFSGTLESEQAAQRLKDL